MTRIAALVLALFVASGCYVHTRIPMDRDLDRTELGPKTGRSSYQSVLWVVVWGDAGTQAAAQDGNLKTINHADQEIFVLLAGLYARVTTVVYGE